MIQISNLQIFRKDEKLLEINNLKINNENKTIALIGNNGSSKITFAKILANLDKDYEGIVKNLFETVYTEQSYFVPEINISGGEYTKEKILNTFISNKELIIFDEPSVNLDTNNLNFLISKILNHKDVVILISHDRYLIEKVADEIIEIEDKKVKHYKMNLSAYLNEKDNEEKQHNLKLDKYNKEKKVTK